MSLSNTRFPTEGTPWADLEAELKARRGTAADMAWDSTRNLKASYNAGGEVSKVGWAAYSMFSGDNFLYGTSLYPSLPEIADDVVAMGLELLGGSDDAGGTVTTGGTESIILAVRAAKAWAMATKTLAGTPEIVLPVTAHAAFTKAAELMELDARRIAVTDYRADAAAMAEAITENTIMIVGSAHAYPYGHVDPIADLATIAAQHDLWLHVDACIGGFFLPFARQLGEDVPAFDFAVPEVRSISADLHKYGYTPRGASLLLLRDAADGDHQGFRFSDWPTGAFNTQTVSGSRPAGAVAGAWAVLRHLGMDGYRDLVGETLAAKREIIAELETIPEIDLCGAPQGGLIAYRGRDGLDMHAVRAGLTTRGWQTGALIDPPGLQMILNHRSAEIVAPLSADLKDVIGLVKAGIVAADGVDIGYGT